MKILYLCQIIETEHDTGSERHFNFCKYAATKGHQVVAITSNVDYKNARIKIRGNSSTVHRTIDGVDIHYVYSYAKFRGSILKRLYYYLTFFFSSLIQAVKIKRPNVIYAVSTPLSVGLIGYLIARLKRIPFVLEVTDVWPDALIACGLLKNEAVIRFAHILEMFCYKKAKSIVGLTRGICENITAKGIDQNKVMLITNGIDPELFAENKLNLKRGEIREKYGFGDCFTVMYLGAHGAYNALGTIIGASEKLREIPNILFVFVGDGDEKAGLQRDALNKRLNMTFIPPITRLESVCMLSAADAFLLPNRKGEFFSGNLPNKLFDFMATEKPIVVTGIGETSALVLEAKCGLVGPAEDSEFMAKAILKLAEMPENERWAMGRRGREFVLKAYNRTKLGERFLDVLEAAVRLDG